MKINKHINGPTKYGFAAGTISVLEKNLLRKNIIDRLLDSKNFESKIHVLVETSYGHYFDNVKTIEDIEEATETALKDIYKLLEETCHSNELNQFFKLKYDYQNLKTTLKNNLTNANLNTYSELGTLNSRQIINISKDSSISDNKYFIIAIDSANIAYNKKNDPNVIDIEVDKAYLNHLSNISSQLNSNLATNLLKTMIDLQNFKTIIRFLLDEKPVDKTQLIDNGHIDTATLNKSTDSLSSFMFFIMQTKYSTITDIKNDDFETLDKICDDIIINLFTDIRDKIATIEIPISYFLIREYEVKTLRSILISGLYEIPAKTIRKKVIARYV